MEWKSLKECYRACLPLNLPAEAGLIYRSSNNMCPQFPGSPFFSKGFGGALAPCGNLQSAISP